MAVQFILGRSGTGKTTRCIRSIADELAAGNTDQPLILLVPEQATYQAERAILSDSRISGFSNLQILSFDRLQFLLLRSNTAGAEISRIGQEMIIHRILNDNTDKLKIFAAAAHTPGLAEKLTRVIIELHHCARTADDLDRLLTELNQNDPNSLTALKFTDIAFVYRQYLTFIQDDFLNPDIHLTHARTIVAGAPFLQGAKLWVDGFSGFTAQQRLLLIELLKTSSQAHIALCLDPDAIDLQNHSHETIDPASLFNVSEQTYADLTQAVKKLKLALDDPCLLKKLLRFTNTPAIAHIEANLFDPRPPVISAPGDIHVITPPNQRAEITCIARQIRQLVAEKNYRFRDIAVIIPDISAYQHYIQAVFTDSAIPFFIDTPGSLASHPVVELICSALNAVTGDFPSTDIMACLKTSLTGIDPRQIDLLENYCLAFGVDGNDWTDPKDWAYAEKHDKQFDEIAVNRIRHHAVAPLLKLKDDLHVSKQDNITAGKFTCAVFDFLKTLAVPETLAAWADSETDPHQRHLQFYDKLISIFDELVQVFKETAMPAERFAAIIANAFSKLTLKLIPPMLDQVLVGSVERSRHPDLKAVFLIGATQKQFPIPLNYDQLLTDEDRMLAWNYDFELSDTLAQKLVARQYLAYIAFTRPSEKLFITYPLTDNSGNENIPSPFLNNLMSLFSDLNFKLPQPAGNSLANVHTPTQLADLLCQKLGKDTDSPGDPKLASLPDLLCDDTELCPTGDLVKYALSYDNDARLEKTCVSRPTVLDCSPSRLKTFASCPYQHFAKYILRLKPPKLFTFEPIDLGNFYHKVLDALYRRLKKDGKDFASATDTELQDCLTEQITFLMENDSAISNFKNHSRHNAFIIVSAADTLSDCVDAYAQMSRAGAFRQIESEQHFGFEKDKLKCTIKTPDGLTVNLRGVIDRIDIADIDGKKIALIFDYKKTSKGVSYTDIFHGFDLQLLIYMLAIKESNLADDIAGAFFLPVETDQAAIALDDLDTGKQKFRHKAKGILNADLHASLNTTKPQQWDDYYNYYIDKNGAPYSYFNISAALTPDQFADLLEFTKNKIAQLADHITSAEIKIHPYRRNTRVPCRYCDFAPLCRFDWQINDYNFIDAVSKTQLVEILGGPDA